MHPLQSKPSDPRNQTARPFGSPSAEVEVPRNPFIGRQRRKFILCFDGTGNKFSGTSADSNILKIYRMLDRSDGNQYHYYQPGIGTYVTTKSLSHTSTMAQLKSWYLKAKDSAIGTSFADHVMGGYKFLMRFYSPEDDIYLFGFSRGAYIARFLAEMLDHVGLLSAGNEEMACFAWKTFQKWQVRLEGTEKEKREKKYLLDFMCAFRETFSRPVRRIRFLGLFDTVNSVPRFENAWMQRSKFPYTARSTAKIIRHAVAIDERRAKFRHDLISETKPHHQRRRHHRYRRISKVKDEGSSQKDISLKIGRHLSQLDRPDTGHLNIHSRGRSRDGSEPSGIRSLSPGNHAGSRFETEQPPTLGPQVSLPSFHQLCDGGSEEESQDIQEVWFAGCHADIGGGWSLEPGEDFALSHIPLVWMIREGQKAGLHFDEIKLRAFNCCPDGYEENTESYKGTKSATAPEIAIGSALDPASLNPEDPTRELTKGNADVTAVASQSRPQKPPREPKRSRFHQAIHAAAIHGKIHDVLQFNNGVSRVSVVSWNIMEYLPFRRMDLRPDGLWRSVAWPLPKGEVRDVPESVVVHNSVLRRMDADESYRPGNLICGGGGRGVRKAPKEMGKGEWKAVREVGDPVGECFVRAAP